ncbi:hypothetical protein [Neobacillus dielmonensis]|uniref:hypothetical protein n=1 Tax=Neobacillus dielmonensis TaxID=1347369 RepID=UPI0005A8F969|nr:hypothetical protein [Neobacillus dielmonensis]
MNKAAGNEMKRGQAISFRIPSDTPDHLVKQLQKIKETERRNFSSTIAEFVLQGVSQSFSREKETITIPLPRKLTKAQRDWLKHEHSEALLGSIVYQLIADPVRSASLLASLTSNALDIDEALYLQEQLLTEQPNHHEHAEKAAKLEEEPPSPPDLDIMDDLNMFDWENAVKETAATEEEEEEELDADDLLGGFLANMNK